MSSALRDSAGDPGEHMADSATDSAVDPEEEHAAAIRRRYLIRFEEDTLRSRPLWIRLIIEFARTVLLLTVAAGAGVVNPYAWGPLSGLHINPAVTLAFTGRGVFPRAWLLPYWAVQLAGAIAAALFLQGVFGDVAKGGNYPIAKPGGDWRAFVMEIVLTAILVSVILHTATGGRSIGHNAAIAVGSTVALLGLFASPISGASMNPARTLGPGIG